MKKCFYDNFFEKNITKKFIYPKILRYIMVYLQLDVPDEINDSLKIMKVKRKDTTIQETAIYVLKKYVPMELENGN